VARLNIIYFNKKKKSECVSGIVQGAGPNVEAGLSLGTTDLESSVVGFINQNTNMLQFTFPYH